MKFITPELEQRFKAVGEQDVPDPLIIAKFFLPISPATCWAITYYPEENICFGYVTGLFVDELGYFSIDELESLRITPLSFRIEWGLYFKECRLSDVKSGKVC